MKREPTKRISSRPPATTKQNVKADRRAARDRQQWKPGTMLFPLPVVMVTSVDAQGRPNICTVAWTGTVCTDPPMLSISLRPATLSHQLIRASGEFVVNVPSVHLVKATDFCGVASGRDVDKFEKTGLTSGPAATVRAPLILEAPINLECKTRKTLELGSHTMFLAEITAVQVKASLLTPSGRLALEKDGLAAFAHGGYYALGKKIGFFGFSVQKKRTKTTR